MTNISGVANNAVAAATTNTSTTNSGSTGVGVQGATVEETSQGTVVKIKQADGSTFDYVIPSVKQGEDGKWQSVPAKGMDEFATAQNRKYGMQLDADDFMSLLVAQLRFQDPSKPADTGAMMQQTAALGMVERVSELATAAEAMTASSKSLAEANTKLIASNDTMAQSLQSLLNQQSLSASIGLIGQNITYTTGTDKPETKSGVVESVKLGTSGPILSVNGADVPIAQITGVSRTGQTSSAGAST